MSRLDELIQELCPDGVECKTLEEAADIGTGILRRTKVMRRIKYSVQF